MQNNAKPERLAFLRESTLIGSKTGMAFLFVLYSLALGGEVAYGSYILTIAVGLHVLVTTQLDMISDRPPVKHKMLRLVNEVAMSVAAGWLGFLVLVFFVGGALFDSEKVYGIAFGAGLGLLLVFTPALVVSLILTNVLKSKQQRV